MIAAGFPRADLETVFASCELAGHFTIPYGIENYAIGHAPDILRAGTQRSRGICSGSDFARLGRP